MLAKKGIKELVQLGTEDDGATRGRVVLHGIVGRGRELDLRRALQTRQLHRVVVGSSGSQGHKGRIARGTVIGGQRERTYLLTIYAHIERSRLALPGHSIETHSPVNAQASNPKSGTFVVATIR